MTETGSTPVGLAPFGPKGLNIGTITTNILAENCPKDAKADKWLVLRHCVTAKAQLGVSGRALTVLSALLSCHKETELRASDNLVVFPSNKELARRAHGISEPTLRRALAQLVAARLLARRDSPNGKRYARRGVGGDITRVFGFDLRPLLARAADIALMAEDVAAERREMADLRERITLTRRDIVKSFALAQETDAQRAERAPAGLELQKSLNTLYEAFLTLPGANLRGMCVETLGELAYELDLFLVTLSKELKKRIISSNMSGNHNQTERHKQDSNQNPILESEFLRTKELEGNFSAGSKSVDAKVDSTSSTNPHAKPIEEYPDPHSSYSGLTRVSINVPSGKLDPRIKSEGDDGEGVGAYVETAHACKDSAEFGAVNASVGSGSLDNPGPEAVLPDGNSTMQSPIPKAIPLASILAACPDIVGYGRGGIGSWGELIGAARVARAAMGISPSAWQDAERAMGSSGAAVTVATILQRYDEINSPGGYLRSLSDKASCGKFTPTPVVQSLLRRQLESEVVG